MNKLHLIELGGLPMTQRTLDFIQASFIGPINGIASAFGQKVILQGVTDLGATYSDGWVLIDGEILPFTGGLKADNIIVEQTAENRLYGDGVEKVMYITRVAKCGVAGGSPFTDFKRLGEMIVPSGAIMLWSGSIASIPAGWLLCDGTNGTPNLTDRFVMGGGGAAAIGGSGGSNSYILSKAQLPNITLRLKTNSGADYVRDTNGGGSLRSLKHDDDNGLGGGYLTTEPLGSGNPIDNRPAYYVLAYIMKK